MQFFILVLLICFFIFLFSLYLLTRDDFVLIRKDITPEKSFNIAFVTFAVSIFVSRITHIILNPSSNFLNPLVVLLFPYYPGLSLMGGVGGGVLFLIILGKYQKLPTGRLLDIFSISFLSALPVGLIGYFFLNKQNLITIEPISMILAFIVLLFIFIKILLPRFLSGALKDGTIGLLFLICFATITLVFKFVGRVDNLLNLNLEDLILVIILYASLVFLFRQEKIIAKIKKIKKLKKLA